MSSKLATLPEKNYFAPFEVACRWECPDEQVIHYIEEGMIRPAIKKSDLRGLGLFDMALAIQEEASHGRHLSAKSWTDHWQDPTTTQENLRNAEASESVGQFLYIVPKHVQVIVEQTIVYVLEDYHGKEYGLYHKFGEECRASLDISAFIIRGAESPNQFAYYDYSWCRLFSIITREERDRFEQEHCTPRPSGHHLLDYSTPYLDVMRQAISEFFAPRRPVDAKREEVEVWITERLEAAGTEGSQRIAGAMFTIIKPSDHNPKKRRG